MKTNKSKYGKNITNIYFKTFYFIFYNKYYFKYSIF